MRCAVVGDPVGHSLSPALHHAAYGALGLDWAYDAQRVPAGGLARFADGLDAGWRGLSVTMPLKREAYALADDVDEVAAQTGAVNTLVLDGAGRHGHNTDVPGAVAAMAEHGLAPRTVTVLGGGATAASVALAACDLGARRVRFCVREPGRAAESAAAVTSHPGGPAVEIELLAPVAVAGDLVVSTVPPDAQTEALVAACVAAAGRVAVFEALYDPWPTPLAAAAAATGMTLVTGLDLLVHQAVLQLALFTGRAAPTPVMRAVLREVMRDAGLAALAARPSRHP